MDDDNVSALQQMTRAGGGKELPGATIDNITNDYLLFFKW
jgi:hypothetical protein